MAFSLKTHVKNRPSDGREAQLVRVTPYVRLNAGDGPPIYIQNGQFYCEAGDVIKAEDLPPWFEDELEAMTPEARKEVGL